ncbi:hypothetical protein MYMA111404_00770 [Mycoplasma marinum]|uniref:Uncharacterized protein n=1 Tax=Mycoplasma marinum TaxID=1937190 RepID=A0A4R0XV87_9MOLU|nr:hypothetical protein [Mycoplasma marinum]TCG11639.1 hypothetical protein C4B24_01585 [Mycoplasma marinum]
MLNKPGKITNNQSLIFLKNIYKAKAFKLLLVQLLLLLIIILGAIIFHFNNEELKNASAWYNIKFFGEVTLFLEWAYFFAYIHIYFYEYDLRKKVIQKAQLNNKNIQYLEKKFQLNISEDKTFWFNLKTCRISFCYWFPFINIASFLACLLFVISKKEKEKEMQEINFDLINEDPAEDERQKKLTKNIKLKREFKRESISFSNMLEFKMWFIGFLLLLIMSIFLQTQVKSQIKKSLSLSEEEFSNIWISISATLLICYLSASFLTTLKAKCLRKIINSVEINESNIKHIEKVLEIDLTTKRSTFELFKVAKLKWYYWLPVINVCCLVLLLINAFNFNKNVNNKINEINILTYQNIKKESVK